MGQDSPKRLAGRDRDRAVKRVLWLVLVLNVAIAALKLGLGLSIGALSLMADGVHAALDASANIVGLVGISLAARPPDRDHPYGHRRFEALAALAIGLLIAGGLVEILRGVVAAMYGERAAPDVSWFAAIILAVTIVANLAISRYESAQGRALRSAILVADSSHTLSDAFGALAVLASFGAIALGYPFMDWIAALCVAVLIGRTALRVLRQNLGVLLDTAQLDPMDVHRIVLQIPGVEGAHRIRSRGATDHVHLDLHIHVHAAMNVAEAHELTHRVADALRDAYPEVHDVVIHTEPADGRETDLSAIAPAVSPPAGQTADPQPDGPAPKESAARGDSAAQGRSD